jgi:hypothetical protein
MASLNDPSHSAARSDPLGWLFEPIATLEAGDVLLGAVGLRT